MTLFNMYFQWNKIWLPVLSALNKGSALNPRFLNPGSTVHFTRHDLDTRPVLFLFDAIVQVKAQEITVFRGRCDLDCLTLS